MERTHTHLVLSNSGTQLLRDAEEQTLNYSLRSRQRWQIRGWLARRSEVPPCRWQTRISHSSGGANRTHFRNWKSPRSPRILVPTFRINTKHGPRSHLELLARRSNLRKPQSSGVDTILENPHCCNFRRDAGLHHLRNVRWWRCAKS